MPKIFSDIEKDIQRNTLFEKGLQMIVERGYKNVTVDELVTLIGSSKGYFYRLFESKEEFFLQAISWQMTQNLEILTAAAVTGPQLMNLASSIENSLRRPVQSTIWTCFIFIPK